MNTIIYELMPVDVRDVILGGKGKTFGQWLTEQREKAGINQAELARRVKVSANYISNLERDFSPSSKKGKPRPSVEVVDRIARALGVSVDAARLAAGYAPADFQPLEPLGPDDIPEAEIALFSSRVKKLNPQQKRDFKIAWLMANDLLDRLEKESSEKK